MPHFTYPMCILLSTRATQIWLVGPSIGQVWSEPSLPETTESDNTKPRQFQRLPDWASFRRSVSVHSGLCRKQVVVLFDVSLLTHEQIAEIRSLRINHPHFAPVIYFDQPHLGKVIHTFNSDLAGYCTYADQLDELTAMIHKVNEGKLHYSTGFCALLEGYGFPIQRDS